MSPSIRRPRTIGMALTSLVACSITVASALAQATPREGIVEVPGARLAYLDGGGSGPAVVLLHAATGSARVWDHQWAPLGAGGYRVIAYDRRGYGRSTVEPGGPVGTAADDLKALTDALGLERFHLVGTAAGGIVAIDFALGLPRSPAQPGGRQQPRRGHRRVVRRPRAAAAAQGVRGPATAPARARPGLSRRRSRRAPTDGWRWSGSAARRAPPRRHSRPGTPSPSSYSKACACRRCC